MEAGLAALAAGLGARWRELTALLPDPVEQHANQALLQLSRALAWASGQSFWAGFLLCLLCVLATRCLTAVSSLSKDSVFRVFRSLPFVGALIAKEKAQMRAQMMDERRKKAHAAAPSFCVLPHQSSPAGAVLRLLKEKAAADMPPVADGHSHMSGAIYIGSTQHKALLDQVYALFSISNPLHSNTWPSVSQMEAEVVACTAAMLGGTAHADGAQQGAGRSTSFASRVRRTDEVCGAMTSGGTESILTAMLASRDFMIKERGVSKPQILMAASAHAAYWKAAQYFQLDPVVIKVGPSTGYRLTAAAVRRHLTSRTAIVIASSPGFPHGVVDDVEGIGALCVARGICMHVDACLGGYVLPFARKLGYPVPPFDFSVHGPTSMSVDTHKFGLAHKGTSVVLYRGPWLRRYQYTGIASWTGGLYISPGFPGSRPGALIATAWAAIVAMGEEGYLQATKRIMATTERFRQGLRERVPEMEEVGEPAMSVVAFKARDEKALNVYQIMDLMEERGWHLNALQFPSALHFCFTAAHSEESAAALVDDLAACVAKLLADPSARVSGGTAPIYGKTVGLPDRGLVSEFLEVYQDVQLEVCN